MVHPSVRTEFQEMPIGHRQAPERASTLMLALFIRIFSHSHPDNGGTGSGLVEVSIAELWEGLNRAERSVWRGLKASINKDFLHSGLRVAIQEGACLN
jgi:hypothetical protein